jgi:hypothetical protein
MDAVDAMDALDASAERVVELVGQVGPEQWSNPTPCTEWNVRTLVAAPTRPLPEEATPLEQLIHLMGR